MRHLIYAALLALATSTTAHAGNLLDLAIIDRDTGETLSTYARDGKVYIAGVPGHRYSVRMTNRSGVRVLAVLSVDGVNAISGETANAAQTGYVLNAWQSTEVNGWRKNLNEIAQFNFTALPDSYAAQTGRPANVGVIGVAVFKERAPIRRRDEAIASAPPATPAPMAERESSTANNAEPSTAAMPQAKRSAAAPAESETRRERLGTGHGEREWSQVTTTNFVRASSRPAETVSVFYDSYRNLAARGIVPRTPLVQHDPNPFPAGFVPDPPRRR
jgi:hypothetical protein